MSLARYKNGKEALVIDQLWSTVGRSVVRHVQSGAIYIFTIIVIAVVGVVVLVLTLLSVSYLNV